MGVQGKEVGEGLDLTDQVDIDPLGAKGTGVLIKLFIVWPIDQRRWTAGRCV